MFQTELDAVLKRYSRTGAVIDTNLFLLLIIGTYRIDRIESFKRTSQYEPDDFELLLALLLRIGKRFITPNIATEADNLSRQLPEWEYTQVSQVFRDLCSNLLEIYVPTKNLSQNLLHERLGLTDCITMALAKQKHLVITTIFSSQTASTTPVATRSTSIISGGSSLPGSDHRSIDLFMQSL